MIEDNNNIENLIKSASDNLLLPVNLKRVEGRILESNEQKNISIIDINSKINLKQPIETIRSLQEVESTSVADYSHKPVFLSNLESGFAYDTVYRLGDRNIKLAKKSNKTNRELNSKIALKNSPFFKIAYNESEYGIDNYEVDNIELSNNNSSSSKLNRDLKLPEWIANLQETNLLKTVNGRILNSIKGGFSVGIAGFVGFLPYGHLHKSLSNTKIDNSVMNKLDFLYGELLPFGILKVDSENIVLTRRTKNKENAGRNTAKNLASRLKHRKFIHIETFIV